MLCGGQPEHPRGSAAGGRDDGPSCGNCFRDPEKTLGENIGANAQRVASKDIRVREKPEEADTKELPEETRRVELADERRTVTLGTPKGFGVRDRTGPLVMINRDVVQAQTVEEPLEPQENNT